MQSGCLVGVVSGGGPELQGQLEVMGVMRVEITDLCMCVGGSINDTER